MCTTRANGQFDETFPQMLCEIETLIPTGKSVTPKEKISATKSYLDCEISALNDKTNTLSASIDLSLKAIEEKQRKLFGI